MEIPRTKTWWISKEAKSEEKSVKKLKISSLKYYYEK